MKRQKISTVAELFLCFLKIGAFTFGGGYAMIPLIHREAVHNKKWIDEGELLEVIAIAESSPGPIAVNAATFVGRRTAGFWGAFFATLGVVLPSFIIILLVASVLDAFSHLRLVKYAFWGIRAGILALILNAAVTMFKKSERSAIGYTVMFAAFGAVTFLNVGALYIIAGSALIGVAAFLLRERRQNK